MSETALTKTTMVRGTPLCDACLLALWLTGKHSEGCCPAPSHKKEESND